MNRVLGMPGDARVIGALMPVGRGAVKILEEYKVV